MQGKKKQDQAVLVCFYHLLKSKELRAKTSQRLNKLIFFLPKNCLPYRRTSFFIFSFKFFKLMTNYFSTMLQNKKLSFQTSRTFTKRFKFRRVDFCTSRQSIGEYFEIAASTSNDTFRQYDNS